MEWIARIFPNASIALIQDSDGNLYRLRTMDIYAIARWIRNRPGIKTVGVPKPLEDSKTTRKYTEYKFLVLED